MGANPPRHTLRVRNNAITLDGKPGRITYRSAGDLDGDGRTETVFSVMLGGAALFQTVIARPAKSGWSVIAVEESAYCFSKTDVADVNGDGKLEIIVRSMSGDGHNICSMYNLKSRRLVEVPTEDDFLGLARFSDIDHDGKLELLSIRHPSGSLGDFWLTIYKWDGRRYVDVSERFPAQYDAVIRRIKKTIYRVRYTRYYGEAQSPDDDPWTFGELYCYLGRAYELRREPAKARAQYAIAYRLSPDSDWIANAFRRTCVLPKSSDAKKATHR